MQNEPTTTDTLDRHTETRQALERPKLDVKPMSWSKVVQIALDHRIPSEGAALGLGSRTRPVRTVPHRCRPAAESSLSKRGV